MNTNADGPLHLTIRETQVLHWMAHGKHNKDIAIILNISEHTAKFHVNSVLLKTKQNSRLGAVIYALKLNILNIKDLMPELNLAMAKGEIVALPPVLTMTAISILEENKQYMKQQIRNLRENIVNDIVETFPNLSDSTNTVLLNEIITAYIPDA